MTTQTSSSDAIHDQSAQVEFQELPGKMATMIANKPAPPHQKMKRPPSAVPSNANGVKTSQSPSPSLAHKRLPSTIKHPPSANAAGVNGTNGIVNGAARLSNRRRDSQKPGDVQPRSSRPNKIGPGEVNPDKRKRLAEPYVNMASYILRKFKNKQPSLIIHLHLTHFRFDQQDVGFSYNSPMKIILEHLRSQTVPHDMIEELNAAGVKFYEGCLIVQVQDHRTTGSNSQTSSSTTGNDKNVPFSIHNYNEHLTPSPFVPYPKSAATSDPSSKIEKSKQDIGKTEKESSQGDYSQKGPPKGPRIFTTVLFPTQQSVEEELYVLANTPDPRANNRKQSQASASSRTPASATMPHPPTPLSAVPPTLTAGPPSKKQKMLLKESDVRELQTKLTTSFAHPLYLEPVASLQEASKLIQCLTDSLHKEHLPSPKTRKRTVAELEADEAHAASEQRFMLIMDERLAASAAGTKAGNVDGEAGAAVFEPRFERFKTIENIKAAHREKEQQMQEARAQQQAQIQAANKIKQEQVEQQKLFVEKKNAEAAQREQQLRMHAMQNSQNVQQQKVTLAALQHQQQQLAANPSLHGHGPTANGTMTNQQNIPVNSQPPHSSPISRHMTPHSNPRSSPLVGNVPHSVPMNVTSSGQGITSSPARPTSAAQHGHPGGSAAMVARGSQQRPPSRMGTPSMPTGTPSMQHGTPVIKQGTPTPRITQGSPPNGMSHNPMTNSSGMAGHHMGGQPNASELYDRYQREQRAAHQIRQQQFQVLQQQNLANNMSPNHGMSPMHMAPQTPNLQHLAAQNQGISQQTLRAYQARQSEYHRQMNGAGGPNQMHMPSPTPNPHGRPMPPQPPHPSAPVGNASSQGQLQQRAQAQQHQEAQMQMALYNRAFTGLMKTLAEQYGAEAAVPPEAEQAARQKAVAMAKSETLKRQQQRIMRMAGGMGGPGGGGGGMNAMNGTNGMNVMNGMNGMNSMYGMGAMGAMGMHQMQ
ncbi:MAG: hypothetical protein Q9171_007024 [Xanthocarpia ochracea]